MQFRFIIAGAMCFLALPCCGDVITSTSCGAIGASASSQDPCSVSGLYGSLAMASESLSVTIGTNSFSATASAYANAFSGYSSTGMFGWADASAEASYMGEFTTAGPVRQGVLSFSANLNCGTTDGTLGAGASVDGHGIANGPPSGPSCSTGAVTKLPITLGQLFSVNLLADASIYSDAESVGSVSALTQLQFSLFEADGVTPVALMDPLATPEPGSFTMLALAAAWIIVWRKSRSAASPGN